MRSTTSRPLSFNVILLTLFAVCLCLLATPAAAAPGDAVVIECPTTYPATRTVTVDGRVYSLSGCDITGAVVIEVTFPGEGVHSSPVTTTFSVTGNTIRNSVMIRSTLTSGNIANLDAASAALAITVESNTAKPDTTAKTLMQVGFSGDYIARTTLAVKANDYSGMLGDKSFATMLATIPNSITTPDDATFSKVGTLGGARAQTAAVLTTMGITPPTDLAPVITPFLLANLQLAASTATLSIEGVTISLDTDPLTLATSASGSPEPETVATAFVAVYGTITLSSGASATIRRNTYTMKPTIDVAKLRNIILATSFLYAYKSGSITAGGGGSFSVTGNTYTAGIAGGFYTLKPSNVPSVTKNTTPDFTLNGLDKSVTCFAYISEGVVVDSQTNGTFSLSGNTITMAVGLPSSMVQAALNFPSVVTLDTMPKRGGFMEVISGTDVTPGTAPQLKASASNGLIAFDTNTISITGVENVTGAVAGMGQIPCDATPYNTATACRNAHTLTTALSNGGKLSMSGNTITVSADGYLYPSVASAADDAVGTAVAGILVPSTTSVAAGSAIIVSQNKVTVTANAFPNTAAWFAASAAFRDRNLRPAPLNVFATFAHSVFSYAITFGDSIAVSGTDAAISVLENTLTYGSNGFGATRAFVNLMVERGAYNNGNVATAMTFSGEEKSFFEFGGNVAKNSINMPSSSDASVVRPPLLAGAMVMASSTSEAFVGICLQPSDTNSFFGISPASQTTDPTTSVVTDLTPSVALTTNGAGGSISPPIALGSTYCGDYKGNLHSNTGGSNGGEDPYESHRRRLISGAITTCAVLLLLAGSFFGAPLTEVQCVIMLFLANCATDPNHGSMIAARYFLSPLQAVGTVDALSFNIALMCGVWIVWAVLIILFTKCFGERTYQQTMKMFLFPGAPLILSRLFLPGIWYNAFHEIDHNEAAMWAGVVFGVLLLLVNFVVLAFAKDMYYNDGLDDPFYNFFFPDTTVSLGRSYFHTVGTAADKLVILHWLILPIVVAGITCGAATHYGSRCGVPWGFLVAIFWLYAIAFIVTRPHSSAFRSFLYAAIYIVMGIITLTIVVNDSTAAAVFCFFLLFFVLVLVAHTFLMWMYTFCYRDGASKSIDDRATHVVVMGKLSRSGDDGADGRRNLGAGEGRFGENNKYKKKAGNGPDGVVSLDTEIDRERNRQQREDASGDAAYDKMYLGRDAHDAPKRPDNSSHPDGYGYTNNDNSNKNGPRGSSDAQLEREYRAMLSGTAKGQEDADSKRRKEEKEKADVDKFFADRAEALERQQKSTAAASSVTSPNAPMGSGLDESVAYSSLGSPMPLRENNKAQFGGDSSASATATGRPAAACSVPVPNDDDDEDLDPREKRRRRMEREDAAAAASYYGSY